jgi:hypothetical protein
LANELAAIENPTDDQQHLKVILESIALQMQAARGASTAPNPSRGPDPCTLANSRQGNPHRVPAHSCLGLQGNQNKNQGVAQSVYHHQGYRYNNRKGRGDSKYREASI